MNKHVIEEVNNHNKLVYLVKVLPDPIANRDILARYLWKAITGKGLETYLLVVNPEEDARFQVNEGKLVRGKYPISIKLARLSDDETKVEYLMSLDFGFQGAAGLVNKYKKKYMSYNLKRTTGMQQYCLTQSSSGLLPK